MTGIAKLSRQLGPVLRGGFAYSVLFARTRGFQDRRISAMMRVRNEEEFLEPAVRSIVGHVDEIVLVDNLSSDGTPEIIAALKSEYPGQVVALTYPHEVARVGSETRALALADPGSPNLSANYYNWCLERCTRPYVLKWDGDMVASERLSGALARWRSSAKQILELQGVNVHPDLEHLAAARCSDRAVLTANLGGAPLPRWVTTLTHDHPEPRLFPRPFATYTPGLLWTQRFHSPLYQPPLQRRCTMRAEGSAYLHLKFCKREPLAAYSPELGQLIASNVSIGPILDADLRRSLRRWVTEAPSPSAHARTTDGSAHLEEGSQ